MIDIPPIVFRLFLQGNMATAIFIYLALFLIGDSVIGGAIHKRSVKKWVHKCNWRWKSSKRSSKSKWGYRQNENWCLARDVFGWISASAPQDYLTLSLQSSKSIFSERLKKICINEVVKIGGITNHLSKLWKAKFFILCNAIFLMRLQGKFETDHSWNCWKWRSSNHIRSLERQALFCSRQSLQRSHEVPRCLFLEISYCYIKVIVRPVIIVIIIIITTQVTL